MSGSWRGQETGAGFGIWGGKGLEVHTAHDPVLHMTVFMWVTHEHASLPKATLVHCAVDNVPILHVHGIREEHLIICEAMGIDHAWYQGAAAGQNSLLSATPP
jgi:hypothetical protein